ncbi:MAG: hypothetical protein AAGG00_19070 [Cyanobacteria bacterium P01_H01_bin.150]
MIAELLKAHQRHIKTLIDVLNELKDLATEEYDADRLLDNIRGSLNYIVSEVEPSNVLAMAMIQDASTIQCCIDQSEFLINAASAILNKINADMEAAHIQKTE